MVGNPGAEHPLARGVRKHVMTHRTPASGDRRERIFERDEFRCAYCGDEPAREELTVDHVEPRVKGGDNSDGNLVACCRTCNTEKGGRAAWEFLSTRPERRAHFLRHARSVWPRLRDAVAEAGGSS